MSDLPSSATATAHSTLATDSAAAPAAPAKIQLNPEHVLRIAEELGGTVKVAQIAATAPPVDEPTAEPIARRRAAQDRMRRPEHHDPMPREDR